MRLSDADREHLYDQLSEHASLGRLSLEELERRVAAVAEATTREEATNQLSDLPGLARQPESSRSILRRGGHGEAQRPAIDWRPTDERFPDPRTRQVMRVWVDADGGRHYVPDEG